MVDRDASWTTSLSLMIFDLDQCTINGIRLDSFANKAETENLLHNLSKLYTRNKIVIENHTVIDSKIETEITDTSILKDIIKQEFNKKTRSNLKISKLFRESKNYIIQEYKLTGTCS